jgi:formylglycine-generating enzyme required for sulfatase activity
MTPAGDEPRRSFGGRNQVFVEELGVGAPLIMTRTPAGTFQIGSPKQEQGRSAQEGPVHEVRLAEFLIGQTPITQAQWRLVAGWIPREWEHWGRDLNPEPAKFQGEEARLLAGETNADERPVERVSWLDAMEFCSRLSQRTGRNYTLPSEAQWEYACRAGTTRPFHFGDTISPELANYNGDYAFVDGPKGINREQTTPVLGVGQFPANAWGMHDMHGNVYEWCLGGWQGSRKEKQNRKEEAGGWRLLERRPQELPLGLPVPQRARQRLLQRRFPCGLPPPGPFP